MGLSTGNIVSFISVPPRGRMMRRRFRPGELRASISGRWGPRRVRVEECSSILTAERVYTSLLADPDAISIGRGGEAHLTVGDRTVGVQFEVRANAVWRFGRVFLTCPMCSGRATRIYLPRSDSPAGCRRCWGLSYDSRKASYRVSGPWGRYLGSWGEAATILARERRSQASAARYEERREILQGRHRLK